MSGRILTVGLFGIGHFGYAVLRLLASNAGTKLNLRGYDRNPEIRSALIERRCHPLYETPQPLPENIRIVHDVADLMVDLDVLVLSVTSKSTREVTACLTETNWTRPLNIVNTAKALDYATGRPLSEIVSEQLAGVAHAWTYSAMAGGTIAAELLLQNPLGLTIASKSQEARHLLKGLFASSSLWVQSTSDLIGVEHAGAFKNVIAICAGMVRGLGLSYGAETHLISRMAAEVATFCVNRLGAAPETFSIGSQCWGSDLWMSCTGETRNRALGELLGKGSSLDQANEIMASQNKTVEGVQTLRALAPLLEQYSDELRLTRIADQVVMHAASPERLIEELMRDDEE